jgi:hypothetical protein
MYLLHNKLISSTKEKKGQQDRQTMLSLCYKLHLGLSKRDLNLKFEHKNQGKNPPYYNKQI